MIPSRLRFIRISFSALLALGATLFASSASAQATHNSCETATGTSAISACDVGTRAKRKSTDAYKNDGFTQKSYAIAKSLKLAATIASCLKSSVTSPFSYTQRNIQICWRSSDIAVNACLATACVDNSRS